MRTLILGLACVLMGAVSGIAAPPAPRPAFYSLQADGTAWEKFFQLPQVGTIGSPRISRDGTHMAFDGWMPDAGEGTSDARMFVLTTQRDELWLLGNGCMPSWGPDNTRLACSFYSGGVGLLAIDTQEVVTIDRNGWGAQWSPDGKSIAYAAGRELRLYDPDNKKTRTVFNAEGQYSSLGYNGTWSPDNQRFLFLATRSDGTKDIVSIKVVGEDADLVRHVVNSKSSVQLAWHPTQPRVVFSQYSAEQKRSQLFEFDPVKNTPPKRIEGQDPTLDVHSPAWTPDGKRLYCVGKAKPAT